MRSGRRRVAVAILAACVLLANGCQDRPDVPEPVKGGSRLERDGDEISVCGQLYNTGARVVLWNDEGGYDAYRLHRHFDPDESGPSRHPDRLARYDSFRRGLPDDLREKVRKRGWSVEELATVVTQVVIHFDACGTSRRCFEVLHDVRGLSTHFMIDLDGTIYQTLDVKERAWHAGVANDRSIGIELASFGATSDSSRLDEWYDEDGAGPRIVLPPEMGDGGLPDGFVGRPARARRFRGVINGREVEQHDFTEEQYRALGKLLRSLREVLPRIEPRIPTGQDGDILPNVLPEAADLEDFAGLLAHWHVSGGKVDPGPAFDWDRILDALARG